MTWCAQMNQEWHQQSLNAPSTSGPANVYIFLLCNMWQQGVYGRRSLMACSAVYAWTTTVNIKHLKAKFVFQKLRDTSMLFQHHWGTTTHLTHDLILVGFRRALSQKDVGKGQHITWDCGGHSVIFNVSLLTKQNNHSKIFFSSRIPCSIYFDCETMNPQFLSKLLWSQHCSLCK